MNNHFFNNLKRHQSDCRRRAPVEAGQSLLELALVVLILIIIISGIVDLGRVLFYFQAMRDAAQEGAAYASAFPVQFSETVPPTVSSNCSTIRQRVQANLPNDNLDIEVSFGKDGTYYPCDDTVNALPIACGPNTVKVVVRKAAFPLIMPVSFIVGSSISLEAPITATILQPLCK